MIELIFHLSSTWWSFLPSLRLIVFSSRHMMEQVSTRSLFGKAVGKLWHPLWWLAVILKLCFVIRSWYQDLESLDICNWLSPIITIWYPTWMVWAISCFKKKNVWGRWFNFSIYNNWCSKYCSQYTWTLWAAFSSALILLKQSCDLYLSSNFRCLLGCTCDGCTGFSPGVTLTVAGRN